MTPESADGLDVAGQTIKNHFDKIARLYEQGAGIERIGRYVKGWWQWVNSGVDVIVQRVEELWKRKWDELHGGIKFYMTSRDSGVNSKAEAARAITVVNAAGPWVNELHKCVLPKVSSLEINLVQGTHIILDAPAPSGIYYLEAADQRAVFVMPYEFGGEEKTMVGTTEKLFQGKADDVKPTEEEVNYLLAVYKSYFASQTNQTDFNVIQQFAGLRVLPKDDGNMFSRPRDTILHWAIPGLLTLYGGKLTAYRSTAESVIKKIKPLLGKKRRIAHTDQLSLSTEL